VAVAGCRCHLDQAQISVELVPDRRQRGTSNCECRVALTLI